MKQIFRLLLFLVCWIIYNGSFANTYMASDLGWKYVGQDSFLVKLTIYKDCNGAALPSSQIVNFYCNSSSSLITSITINTPVPVDVTPVCSSVASRCQNPSSTFPYGIQRYIYQGLVSLSSAGSCCEIRISFSACCRTASITTGAASQNFYTQAVMNRCLSPHDNSPEFTEPPVNFDCISQDLFAPLGIVDQDTNSTGGLLDSFSYEWTQPLVAAGNNTSWLAPYDYDKPIFFWGFPNTTLPFPRGFHLDPQSGDIAFRPMKLETSIMCILLKEYRNRVKIGEIRRDMWITVINCPNNHAPSLGPAVYLKEVCAGDPVNFTINTNDLDPNDTLTISWYNYGISGASWTDNNGAVKHPTGNFSWTTTANMASSLPYTFIVSVKDNGCPIKLSYKHAYQVLVEPYFSASMTVADSGCNKYFFNADVIPNVSPAYYFDWTGSGGLKSTNKSFFFNYKKPGTYPFSLTIYKQGCHKVFYDTNIIDNFLYTILSNDTNVCEGSYVTVNSMIYNAKGNVKYHWNTGDTLHNSITVGPLINDSIILFTVNDSSNCPYTDTMKIKVRKLPKVDVGKDTAICFKQSFTRTASIKLDKNTKISFIKWYNAGNTNLISNLSRVTFSDSGHFVCQVSDDMKCQSADTFYLKVNALPIVSAGKDDSICSIGGVYKLNGLPSGITNSWSGKSVFYNSVDKNWYFDPNGSGIVHLGTYPLVYHLTDINHCYNDDTMNIKVYKFVKVSAGKYSSQCFYNPPVPLIGSPSGGLWYIDGISSGNIFTPSMSNIGKHKIIYNYKLMCENSDTTEIEVIDRPKISISTSTGKTTFCKEQGLIPLDASPFGGPYGGFWSGTGLKGNYFDPSTGNGNYDLIYHFTDMYGCSNEDTLVLTVQDPAVHILNTEKGICTGKAIELRAFKSSEYGLTWKSDSNSGGILTFDPSSDMAFYIPGNNDYLHKFFRLFVKTNDLICSKASDSITIKIGDYPKADFDANKTSGNPPLHVSFIDKTVLTGSLITSYFWDFGDTSFSTVQYPVHDYHFTGTYPVKLRVVSEYGCEDSVIKYGFIKVTKTSVAEMIDPEIMIIPNPANDFFTIKLINSNEVIKSLVILNSVGQVIKSFNDLDVKEFRINRDKIINGIYFLKINFGENKIIYSKILFE